MAVAVSDEDVPWCSFVWTAEPWRPSFGGSNRLGGSNRPRLGSSNSSSQQQSSVLPCTALHLVVVCLGFARQRVSVRSWICPCATIRIFAAATCGSCEMPGGGDWMRRETKTERDKKGLRGWHNLRSHFALRGPHMRAPARLAAKNTAPAKVAHSANVCRVCRCSAVQCTPGLESLTLAFSCVVFAPAVHPYEQYVRRKPFARQNV